MQIVFWVTAVVLVVALSFPRVWLHLFGFLGMGVMVAAAWGNGPIVFLNVCTAAMHLVQFVRFARKKE